LLSGKGRFDFIDQFRGFVGILMLMGHSSYYFNSIWLHLDPLDPLFPDWAQFALRYAGYLCAPGFLMMNGAMVWWSFHRRIVKGTPEATAPFWTEFDLSDSKYKLCASLVKRS